MLTTQMHPDIIVLQSAGVMNRVQGVNKSCGALTKTNGKVLLLPLTLIFPPEHPAGPTAGTVTDFMLQLKNSCSELEEEKEKREG